MRGYRGAGVEEGTEVADGGLRNEYGQPTGDRIPGKVTKTLIAHWNAVQFRRDHGDRAVQLDRGGTRRQQGVGDLPPTHELVLNTCLLAPASNTIAQDVARANEIFQRMGLRVRVNKHLTIRGRQATAIQEAQNQALEQRARQEMPGISEQGVERLRSNNSFGVSDSIDQNRLDAPPPTEAQRLASSHGSIEELALLDQHRTAGMPTVYWVHRLDGAAGMTYDTSLYDNVRADHEGIILQAGSGDTLAHEIVHLLTRGPHTDWAGDDQNRNGVPNDNGDVSIDNLAYPSDRENGDPNGRERGTNLTLQQQLRMMASRYVQLIVEFAGDPVQRSAAGGASVDGSAAHTLAARGVDGAGEELPHLGAIQRSFGKHDVTGVQAHVGGAAREAARGLGATAYASGDDVAFAAVPDLHLAAHEAAHIVQQRGGVRLAGGIGREGDSYERHADQVADRVVRGESAEELLDAYAHRGEAGGPAIQRNGDGATRGELQAAVNRSRDIYELESARRDIGLRESSPPDGVISVGIADATFVVDAADITWLLRLIEARINALQAVQRDGLVDRDVDPHRPAPPPPPMEAEPAPQPRESGRAPAQAHGRAQPAEADGDPDHELQLRGVVQFPMQWSVDCRVGTLQFEVTVEYRAANLEGNIGAGDGETQGEPITVEGVGRRGAVDQSGGGVTVTGGGRAGVEALIHRRLGVPGRDRLRVERRGGNWRGLVGWDFGSTELGPLDVGFRLNIAEIQAGRRPNFLSAEVPIATHWLETEYGDVRLRGAVTLRPSWSFLWDVLRTAMNIAMESVGPAAEAATESTIAALAATIVAIAADPVTPVIIGGSILVGMVAFDIVALALIGVILANEMGGPRPQRRRRQDGPMSQDDIDQALTGTGRSFNSRIHAFCSAYADTMRGNPLRMDGPAAEAGQRAARDWVRELRGQGHSDDSIHAAARSADDLEQRVFAAARQHFTTEADRIARESTPARHTGNPADYYSDPPMLPDPNDPNDRQDGNMNYDFTQRREHATRYMRSCVTLGQVADAPALHYEPCRENDPPFGPRPARGETCAPGGESNPEGENPHHERPQPQRRY